MQTKSQITTTWKAHLLVDLTPVNSYGDELPGSTLSYNVSLTGSLVEIVSKLEAITEKKT